MLQYSCPCITFCFCMAVNAPSSAGRALVQGSPAAPTCYLLKHSSLIMEIYLTGTCNVLCSLRMVCQSRTSSFTPKDICGGRYFPTLLTVLLAVFNDGAMIALAKDRVTPSQLPNKWKLSNIFITGMVYGVYLALSSWVLWCAFLTDQYDISYICWRHSHHEVPVCLSYFSLKS